MVHDAKRIFKSENGDTVAVISKSEQHDELVDKLADWIDTNVLAEALADCLEENRENTRGEDIVSLEKGKELWLKLLDDLYRRLDIVAAYL